MRLKEVFHRIGLKKGALFAVLFLFLFHLMGAEVLARVGGGGSSGSRGSRSYSAPRSPSPSSPMSPSSPGPGTYSSPSRPSAPPPAGSPMGGGFMRGIAGGLLGGFLGSMLFSGLGHGAGRGGLGGGGIGLMEILLPGALAYGAYWFFIKRRRREVTEASYQSAEVATEPAYGGSYGAGSGYAGQSGAGDDAQVGLSYIRQMDPGFDEKRFQDASTDLFFRIQGAWANRDLSTVRNLLTDEMHGIIQGDADRLKQAKQINRLDNIAVRTVEITEAWQESGRDFVTVRFYANLLDYTVDETSGQIVSGSRTEPVKFEEYWTLTRPVGNNPWKLSAIQQPA